MSLSLPYVIRGAAEVRPAATIRLADKDITIAELAQSTAAQARRLLTTGYRPHGTIDVTTLDSDAAVLRALAASRIGLVLTPIVVPPPAPSEPVPDLDIVESGIWSETPLLASPSGPDRYLTHGQFLAAIHDGDACQGWEPLVRIVVDLIGTASHGVGDERRTAV
jgi:hypothetical protein